MPHADVIWLIRSIGSVLLCPVIAESGENNRFCDRNFADGDFIFVKRRHVLFFACIDINLIFNLGQNARDFFVPKFDQEVFRWSATGRPSTAAQSQKVDVCRPLPASVRILWILNLPVELVVTSCPVTRILS